MAPTSDQLTQAAHRATAWLASRLTPEGNFVGNDPRSDDGTFPDTDDIGCYYKSIYTMRAAGQSAASARCMSHVVKRFKDDKDDFYNSPEVRSSGSYGPFFCQIYQNAWLMRGAVALNFFGLAKRIVGFINTQRDPGGGVLTQVGSTTGVMDSNSTAVCAYCNILAGNRELAWQSCDFLLRLLANQKDEGILWSRCSKDGSLNTDLWDVEEKNHRYVRVSAGEPEQAYWIWSWPMNTLIAIYELTDDTKYLDGAIRIFSFLETCHEHAFAFTTSGKTAWAGAKLHRLTGKKNYLDRAMSQMQYVLNHQHADGYMLGDDAKNLSDQPIRTTYDFTGDFGSWLIDNAAEFSFMGL